MEISPVVKVEFCFFIATEQASSVEENQQQSCRKDLEVESALRPLFVKLLAQSILKKCKVAKWCYYSLKKLTVGPNKCMVHGWHSKPYTATVLISICWISDANKQHPE